MSLQITSLCLRTPLPKDFVYLSHIFYVDMTEYKLNLLPILSTYMLLLIHQLQNNETSRILQQCIIFSYESNLNIQLSQPDH